MPFASRTLALMLAVAMTIGSQARGQRLEAPPTVSWTVAATSTTLAPGDSVTLHFDASIEAGKKMYALDAPPPTRSLVVRLDRLDPGLQAVGPIIQETPERGYDPNFQKEVTFFQRSAHLWTDVHVAADAAPGPRTIGGHVTYMVCTDEMCWPPTDHDFRVEVTVLDRDASKGNASKGNASKGNASGRDLSEDGASGGDAFTPGRRH